MWSCFCVDIYVKNYKQEIYAQLLLKWWLTKAKSWSFTSVYFLKRSLVFLYICILRMKLSSLTPFSPAPAQYVMVGFWYTLGIISHFGNIITLDSFLRWVIKRKKKSTWKIKGVVKMPRDIFFILLWNYQEEMKSQPSGTAIVIFCSSVGHTMLSNETV